MATLHAPPTPPTPLNSNTDLEQGVLGAALVFPTAVPDALAAGLHAAHFTADSRRQVWEAILRRHLDGRTHDAHLIGNDLAPAIAAGTLHLDLGNLNQWVVACPVPQAIGDYATDLVELHRRRKTAEHYTDAARAAQQGDHQALQAALNAAGAAQAQATTANPLDRYIDWGAFWEKDRHDADWIVDQVLARGRGHAIYAAHKIGKSLLLLSLLLPIATGPEPAVVVYLDFEMTEDDVYERLEDMGYGPGTDLTRLRYASLPSIPPLNSRAGADELSRIITETETAHPGHHVIVIIDTMSRAVDGDENDASTIQDFYRHTGLMLKQRGCTWARLDHSGKDATRGQRGTSAKGDDVDIVWNLTATDTGLRLKSDAARMNWVPATVDFAKLDQPLRFAAVTGAWPAGTSECASLLDAAGVAPAAPYRVAKAALEAGSNGRRAEVVRAALRFRRSPDYHILHGQP